MDSPSKMSVDVFAFLYDNYQRIERYKKSYLANGVMAGSIATLAALWLALQGMNFFGYSHVIGGYKLPVYFRDHLSATNGIDHEIVINGGPVTFPKLPKIDGNAINDSINFGIAHINRMYRLEKNLVEANIAFAADSPAHNQYVFSSPHDDAIKLQADALATVRASLYLVQHYCRRYGLTEETCAHFVSTQKLDGTSVGDSCTATTTADCDKNAIYRSIDGSCNNPNNPRWGSAFTAYSRNLFPHYADGIQELRRAEEKGKRLPGARVVSTGLFGSIDQSDDSRTLSVMQWGEFLSHDLAHTPVRKMTSARKPISCCLPDGSWPSPRYIHPDCAAIEVPEYDPVYGDHRIRCMNYVRALPVIRQDCTFGPIQQMNQVSHFLDGSTIYGSTLNRSRDLRSFKGGKLLVETHGNHDYLLSRNIDPSSPCHTSGSCYKAGDDRVSFEPPLAVMHTIWHREHNRIAEKIAAINPLWSDEILYQESRRIVVAEIQHITYNEWLPTVLGKSYVESIGLGITSNYSLNYDPRDDPAVSNEAATAVLRFLNDLKQGKLSLPDDSRRHNVTLQLSDYYYKPRVIENDDIFDSLLRGLATQTSNKMDTNFSPDLTRGLYRTNSTLGLDAMSLDIQQGRDHGLPGYNFYRKYCGLREAKKFKDFSDYIPSKTLKKWQKLYSSPNDVDLIIGGIAESSIDDSLLGPTFRCLLSEQFARTRWSDRYFYDSKSQPKSFTIEQLIQLRRVTLARIFCDNSNNIIRMQPNVFIPPQEGNEIGSCNDFEAIPSVDLYAWAEKAKAYR